MRRRCMKKIIFVFPIFFLFVGGCQKEDTVQTVDWYKEHTTERVEMIKRCKNNPGVLAMTPNCINADRADSLVRASKIKHIDLKPLPPEFFQKHS